MARSVRVLLVLNDVVGLRAKPLQLDLSTFYGGIYCVGAAMEHRGVSNQSYAKNYKALEELQAGEGIRRDYRPSALKNQENYGGIMPKHQSSSRLYFGKIHLEMANPRIAPEWLVPAAPSNAHAGLVAVCDKHRAVCVLTLKCGSSSVRWASVSACSTTRAPTGSSCWLRAPAVTLYCAVLQRACAN